MKEYKLIKKYPSLPIDWEIGMLVGTGDRQGLACFSPCNGKYTNKYIYYKEVINNPEFWEEVKETYPIGTKVRDWLGKIYEKKEDGWFRSIALLALNESEIGEGKYYQVIEEPKDYEILSYKQNISNRLYKKDFNNNFIADNGWSLSKPINKHNNISIHSVRRLSDNFVITLGDYCKAKNGLRGEVTTIEFCGNGELRIGSDKRYYVGINDVVKSEVLFRTEDNVEIGEGDKYCCIYKNNFKPFEDLKMFTANNGVVLKDKFLFFSTEEAAREYLIWNKPVLSLKDVASIYPGINKNHNTPSHQAEQLKKLVKSKL